MTSSTQTQVQHFCAHDFLFHGKVQCHLVVPGWRLSTVKHHIFYVPSGISLSFTVNHSGSNPFAFTIFASPAVVLFSTLISVNCWPLTQTQTWICSTTVHHAHSFFPINFLQVSKSLLKYCILGNRSFSILSGEPVVTFTKF